MSRKQALLLALIALLAGLAIFVALHNPKPPFLPRDDVHTSFANAETCLGCHGPNGPVPQSARHPLGRDCTRCHALR